LRFYVLIVRTPPSQSLTEEEIDRYVDFFEDIGLYVSRNLVDIDLLDESFGDYIREAYQDDAIMKSPLPSRLPKARERADTVGAQPWLLDNPVLRSFGRP
jgi:hypothetical protein